MRNLQSSALHRLYVPTHVAHVVPIFMEADVLVTAESSFSIVVSLFTPLYKSVPRQGPGSKECSECGSSLGPVEGRAFKLNQDDSVIGFKSDDLIFCLQLNSTVKRVRTATAAGEHSVCV